MSGRKVECVGGSHDGEIVNTRGCPRFRMLNTKPVRPYALDELIPLPAWAGGKHDPVDEYELDPSDPGRALFVRTIG